MLVMKQVTLFKTTLLQVKKKNYPRAFEKEEEFCLWALA